MQVITISMEEPTLDDTMPDNERVTWAVQAATGLERVRIPYSVLKKMPDVLRESHFQAQCVVRVTANDVFLYDMLPMEAKAVVGGLVVDIGTKPLPETDRSGMVRMLSTVSLNPRNREAMKDCRMQSSKKP